MDNELIKSSTQRCHFGIIVGSNTEQKMISKHINELQYTLLFSYVSIEGIYQVVKTYCMSFIIWGDIQAVIWETCIAILCSMEKIYKKHFYTSDAQTQSITATAIKMWGPCSKCMISLNFFFLHLKIAQYGLCLAFH